MRLKSYFVTIVSLEKQVIGSPPRYSASTNTAIRERQEIFTEEEDQVMSAVMSHRVFVKKHFWR